MQIKLEVFSLSILKNQMEGLRTKVCNALLKAMDDGLYSKMPDAKKAEAANYEKDVWDACNQAYTRAYVGKMTKRCREFYAGAPEIPWLFEGFIRLNDVTRSVMRDHMREFVALKKEMDAAVDAGKAFCNHLRSMRSCVELTKTIRAAHQNISLPTNLMCDISAVKTANAEFMKAVEALSVLQEEMRRTNQSWMSKPELEQRLAQYKTLCESYTVIKIKMDRLLLIREQLRIVYPKDVDAVEYHFDIPHNYEPTAVFPPLPQGTTDLLNETETNPEGEPPRKRAATTTNNTKK
jgi:hypothetical protein